MRHFAAFLVIVSPIVGGVGCASTSPASSEVEQTGARTSDGALLTLHSEHHGPVWKDWEPTPETRVVPAALGETARAFDYWRVADQETIEEIWGAIFPVVDSVRASADEQRNKTLDAVLAAIEPGAWEAPTGMDLTFLVSENGSKPFEGIACRLFRQLDSGTTPVLTVLMLRGSTQSASPNRIIVWAAPRFREAPGMTASFRRDDRDKNKWRRRVTAGLEFPDNPDAKAVDDDAGPLVAKLLTEKIWKRFAGRSYLQSSHSEEVARADRVAGPEAALGLEVTRREIEQVYSDTEFPPRAEFDDLR